MRKITYKKQKAESRRQKAKILTVLRSCALTVFLLLNLFSAFGQNSTPDEPIDSVGSRDFGFNCSNALHINAVCETNFSKEKDAVVLIFNGKYYYTGSLVNTTANEMHNKYYVLTIEECIRNVNPANLKFYWHYESSNCTPNQPNNQPPLICTQGASVVASSTEEEFALLELLDDPGLEWDVQPYYLGWEHSGTIPAGMKTVIHHPKGDIKKISGTTGPMNTDEDDRTRWKIECSFTNFRKPIGPESFGSEGAPLLNSNGKLIGLFLKANCCSGHKNADCISNDYFKKFSWAWDNANNPDLSKRLDHWLDPLGTNPTTLNGRGGCQKIIKLWKSTPKPAYHAVETIVSKQVIPKNATVTYKAGTEIHLEEGFNAKAGAIFHAKIEVLSGCNSTSMPFSFLDDGQTNNDNNEPLPQIPYQFSLLPNPNSGIFQIETNFSITDIANIKIINLLGATIYETENLTSHTIQLPDFTAGLHFVVIFLNNGSTLKQKMVLQR